MVGGAEIARFVEDVVGGQEHLVLAEHDLTALEDGSAVERALSSFRTRTRYVSAHDGGVKRGGFTGQPFQLGFAAFEKCGLLHQVARWISGEGEFGKHPPLGPVGRSLASRTNHAVGVS